MAQDHKDMNADSSDTNLTNGAGLTDQEREKLRMNIDTDKSAPDTQQT